MGLRGRPAPRSVPPPEGHVGLATAWSIAGGDLSNDTRGHSLVSDLRGPGLPFPSCMALGKELNLSEFLSGGETVNIHFNEKLPLKYLARAKPHHQPLTATDSSTIHQGFLYTLASPAERLLQVPFPGSLLFPDNNPRGMTSCLFDR